MDYRSCLAPWRSIVSLLTKTPRRFRPRRRRRITEPAMIERLEDRSLLSAILVTNLADAGEGSLRAAVEQANDQSGEDLIKFQRRLNGTISLGTGQMEITEDLTIKGRLPNHRQRQWSSRSRPFPTRHDVRRFVVGQ